MTILISDNEKEDKYNEHTAKHFGIQTIKTVTR